MTHPSTSSDSSGGGTPAPAIQAEIFVDPGGVPTHVSGRWKLTPLWPMDLDEFTRRVTNHLLQVPWTATHPETEQHAADHGLMLDYAGEPPLLTEVLPFIPFTPASNPLREPPAPAPVETHAPEPAPVISIFSRTRPIDAPVEESAADRQEREWEELVKRGFNPDDHAALDDRMGRRQAAIPSASSFARAVGPNEL